MPDFRTELYGRYVSTFKVDQQRIMSEEFFGWCERKYLPLLSDLDHGDPILELGCGPGDLLEILKTHGFTNVEGIDLSVEQVRIATNRGLKARVADVFETLSAHRGRYQAIVAVDFFEHFSKKELLDLMPLINGALKPGGLLLAQTPNGHGLFPNQIIYGDLTHMTILTPESLTQLLRMSGFVEFVFRESGPVPRNLKGRLRLIAWGLIKAVANTVRRIETGKTQDVWTENMICAARKPG